MTVVARNRRNRSIRMVATAAAVAAGTLGFVPTSSAAASTRVTHGSHLRAAGTYYSVQRPLCAAPRPGHVACFAVKRVPAARGAARAQPYTVPASLPVGPSGGLTPADLANAYGYNPAGGRGQTVAIVDAYDDPTIAADLDTFDAQYGLPGETASSFTVVNQDGRPAPLPAADTAGWSGEIALDVDAVRAVCHGCDILLVETDSTRSDDMATGVQSAIRLGADEISNSYGGPEPKHASAQSVKKLQKLYTHHGTVITASTGDDGYYSWDKLVDGVKPPATANFPSTLSSVVAVGGTSLALNADGTRHSERVWNNNGAVGSYAAQVGQALGATGGGCSRHVVAKRWQRHVAGYAKTGCGNHRLAADVSADADPNSGLDTYTSYDCGDACGGAAPGWQTVGGTSLSAPLIAAMWALAGGAGGIDYPTLTLYGRASLKHAPRYDVTKGSNAFCGLSPGHCEEVVLQGTKDRFGNPNHLGAGDIDCAFKGTGRKVVIRSQHRQCYAAKGYDGPSGIGTPKGLALFKPLNPKVAIYHTTAHAKAKTFFTGQVDDPFPGAKVTSYSWSFGDGKHAHGEAPKHVYAKPGGYHVTLSVADSYGHHAVSALRVKVRK